jgi:transposase
MPLFIFFAHFLHTKRTPYATFNLPQKNERGVLMFKDYNINQLVLPLNFEMSLQENDIAFAINDLVESIPEEAFDAFKKTTGCPAYPPRMMLKIILCGYTQSVFSGRKIEALLKDSLRMMWLAQGHEPSYRTINRFRVNPSVNTLLQQCFVQFRCQLIQAKEIEEEAIFIDGTKIEANANKYTFVWKKAVDKYSAALIEKSKEKYQKLVEQLIIPALESDHDDELSIEDLETISDSLQEVVDNLTDRIEESDDVAERKALRSERKWPKQHLKLFKDFIERKMKYTQSQEVFDGRNSYSKTDKDATFMRMKEDHMKNGQLKPGYNVQIATEGQYTLAYALYPNPTDTRTLIPFLNRIESNFFSLPHYIVADAGYGSEQNYHDIIENRGLTPLITYNNYRKEKKKKYKQNPFIVDNWTYIAEDNVYICPNDKRVTYQYESHRKDRYGFVRTFDVYECEDCHGCPLREHCTKAKEGNNRRVYINKIWEQQKAYIRAKLSDEKTGKIYGKRKIDVEPVFGFLKAILGFTRFSLRGKERVENELGFALMAVNLRKFAANISTTFFENENTKNKTGCDLLSRKSHPVFTSYFRVLSQTHFYISI